LVTLFTQKWRSQWTNSNIYIRKEPTYIFLTEMDKETVSLLGGEKIETIEEGFKLACEELKKSGISEPTWMFLPHALYSVPVISNT
jgi:hypothetical protein